MYFVYKIMNNINGKIYIGFTSKTIEQRFKIHIHNAQQHINRRLYDAMNHYGYDNFKVESIEENQSIDILKQQEIYWIKFYNSTDPLKGYNMTEGGDGCDCIKHMSPEAKQLRSEKISRKTKGIKLLQEHIEKIRKANTGKHVSDEVKQKLRNCRVGKISVYKDNDSEQIKCYTCPIGWQAGRLKYNLSDKAKQNLSHKSLRVHNNGYINIKHNL